MRAKKNRSIRAVKTLLLALLITPHLLFCKTPSTNTYFSEAEKLEHAGKPDKAIEHYLKAIETDPTHFESHFFLGNTYLRQGQKDNAIKAYQKAVEIKPDSPQTHFNFAVALDVDGQTDKAIEELLHVLAIHPSYVKPRVLLAEIWDKQGKADLALEQYNEVIRIDPHHFDALLSAANLYRSKHNYSKAIELYTRAIELHPHNMHAQFNLGYTYNLTGQLDQAIKTYQNILMFAPDHTDVRCNLAHTLRYIGNVDEAIEQYEQVLKKWPDNASAHYGFSEVLLKAGDFKRGLKHFEWRWKREADTRGFAQEIWDGKESLDGKRILIRAEYGQGDTIQFVRFAKYLKELGATVVAEVQHTLTTLLSFCPFIDEIVAIDDPLPQFDTQIPLMSLARTCGVKTEQDIPSETPYIELDEDLIEFWQQELARDGNFKIGLCWEGSSYYDSIRGPFSKKAMHLALFQALAELPNVTLYSLQWGDAADQVDEVGFEVRTFGSNFDAHHGRFMDTAAVMKNLDLVLTVDTSVAHLAGALDVPTWVILPTVADWRWMLNRKDTPWYPNMRLFRQEEHGNWNDVIEEIKQTLTQLIQMRKKKSDIVSAEISIGELIDKITILQLKNKYITDEEKLRNVRKELDVLCKTRDEKVPQCKELDQLTQQLYNANQRLWDIEDACRNKERNKEFDDEFIQVTRSVYINNDERCAIKRKINLLLGSNLVEEKSYAAY